MPSAIGARVVQRVGVPELPALLDHFYGDPAPNAQIAALALDVLGLAAEGDSTAAEIVAVSMTGLLDLARTVATRCFPGADPRSLRAGVSGAILNHPFPFALLARESPFALTSVTAAPIEGVRRLLLRRGGA
jgi:N-acetylglucosamine kinase-like BadF-type ATPase